MIDLAVEAHTVQVLLILGRVADDANVEDLAQG